MNRWSLRPWSRLSDRQAVLEARSPVPAYSNLLIRLEGVPADGGPGTLRQGAPLPWRIQRIAT